MNDCTKLECCHSYDYKSYDSTKLKDLYISPETLEDCRNWLPSEEQAKKYFELTTSPEILEEMRKLQNDKS